MAQVELLITTSSLNISFVNTAPICTHTVGQKNIKDIVLVYDQARDNIMTNAVHLTCFRETSSLYSRGSLFMCSRKPVKPVCENKLTRGQTRE